MITISVSLVAVFIPILAMGGIVGRVLREFSAVSYTHLRAHETVLDLVCRLLLEKKKQKSKIYEIDVPIRLRDAH